MNLKNGQYNTLRDVKEAYMSQKIKNSLLF